jgi:integrase
MKILTARAVDAVKPGPARIELPDGTGGGLYLAVEPTGTKSWVLRTRVAGKPKRITLGRAGSDGLTLFAARAASATARHRLEQDIGVLTTAAPPSRTNDRIEIQVGAFLEKHARIKTRPTTLLQTEAIFDRLVLPAWHGRSVRDIRRRDVIDLVERIAEERGGYMANRTLGVLSKFFNWLVGRDVIETPPVAGVVRPHREVARDRVLADDEVKRLWLACEGEGAFGPALRLLLLTGQRKNEVCLMHWDALDEAERTWTIPAARAKNGVAHKVPLSKQAWTLIQAMPRFVGNEHVFAGRAGRGAINGGWDKAKTRISGKAGIEESSWRLHDLRRTAASGLQKLGVRVEVIERALNHTSGSFRGVIGVYQRHDYADEIAVALQRWADRVDEIVSGRAAKVVPLRGGKRR